eukprot:scaffold1641_cov64-Cyclotella_meneghiniana.AAC.3
MFKRFWDGSDQLPLPAFARDRLEAKRAAERSISILTPWNVLGKPTPDGKAREDQRSALFDSDSSYLLVALPSIWVWAKQQNRTT